MLKHEFILSFENKQIKRRTEFAFNFLKYSVFDEYKFIYQRDGISLDIECFKDLVPLLKKATKSSLLCIDLFPTNKLQISMAKDVTVHNDMIHLKMTKGVFVYPINNLIRSDTMTNVFSNLYILSPFLGRYANCFQGFLAYKYFDRFLNSFNQINTYKIVNQNTNVLEDYNSIKDYFVTNKMIYLNVYYNFNAKKNESIGLNVYQDNIVFKDILHLNVNEILPIPRNDRNIYLDNIHLNTAQLAYPNFTNIYENVLVKNLNSFTTNCLPTIMIPLASDNVVNINDTMAGNTKNNIVNRIDTIFGITKNNIGNINEVLEGVTKNNIVNYLANTYGNRKNYHDVNAFLDDIVNTYHCHIVNTFKIDYAYARVAKPLLLTNIESFGKDSHFLFSHENKYNIDIVNKSALKSSNYYNDNFSFATNTKFFAIANYTFINKYYSNIHIENNVMPNKYFKNISLDNDYFIIKNAKPLMLLKNYDYISKYCFPIYGLKYNYLGYIYRPQRYINIFHYGNFIERTNYDVKDNRIVDFAKKVSKQIALILSVDIFDKVSKDIYLNRIDSFLNKSRKGIDLINAIEQAKKISKSIIRYKEMYELDKAKYIIHRNMDIDFSEKVRKDTILNIHSAFALKEVKDTALEKDYIPDLFKQYFDTKNQNSIIHVNKVNKPAFTSYIIERTIKQQKNTNRFNTESLLDKVFKDIFPKDNVLCDKVVKDANFLTLLDTMIIKQRIKTWYINDDVFINKVLKDVPGNNNIVFNNKVAKPISPNNNVWFIKEKFKTFTDNKIFIFKRWYDISTLDFNQWMKLSMRYSFIHQDDITVFKEIKEVYLDDAKMWIFKQNYNMDLFEQKVVNSFSKHMKLYEAESIIRTNSFPIEFYDHFYVTKTIADIFLPSLTEFQKIAKEITFIEDDNLNWAWAYTEEEQFEEKFKIDELLLPENDTRYKDFEDIMFNRETLKPRNPVQIIDDYTFIAKYPTQYPIKDENNDNAYENIAIEYLDVRTDIMRKVFVGFHQLWQDHIFEFSRMTIPQSAKTMLDYLYVWILMSFPEDEISEALRVFRQVRWYLESSIIECSEYYITYEPNDLTSGKLDTTNLEIPTDLFPPASYIPQNNTMYIDTNRHIITNNPNKLGQEAHLTIYIDNKRDTTISFSLHTLTPVYIILNEGLPNENILEVIATPTTGKRVYNIPYTGDTNTFTIKRKGSDNHDHEFFIGNIVIAGMGSTGELNIEFNPKIQGNKVLNNVSQKVIAYMNLYINNQDAIESLVKGNIHISEAYEKILNYWNLHWQNQDKGKRLTIKRT